MLPVVVSGGQGGEKILQKPLPWDNTLKKEEY